MEQPHKFTIVRTDLVQDATTILTDSLLIGRLRECELLLNHPWVSRVQAGIRVVDGRYYIFGLRPSNPVTLNGKPIVGNEGLAAGDRLAVGPFLVDVAINDDGMVLGVALQIGVEQYKLDASSPELETERPPTEPKGPGHKKRAAARPARLPSSKTLDVFWDKRMREAGKMVRPSPLFPLSQRRTGKAQSIWTSTTDLARRWPVSFFIWGAIIGAVPALATAYWYANAYAPAPLSRSHAEKQLTISPPIAARANANSCTTCHTLRGSMEAQCANCHSTDAFVATIIKPHIEAGISCANCHPEHRGAEFRADEAALRACTECHNDANKQTYNGRSVNTPHLGTFGYPVANGKWIWPGLNDEEWARKKIPVKRLPAEDDQTWLSHQFHFIHQSRVRLAPGITGGNLQGQLSCSSCHRSIDPPDRATPRTTCGLCHNGRTEEKTGRVLIAADKPNCTSCHVQHAKDQRHWGSSLLAAKF